MPLWRISRKLIGFSGESKKDRNHLYFWFLERIATPVCALARDLSRINFPCSFWCVVFLCIAQSDFILFVDDSLYHTTNGDERKRWAASVSDYRCCPLKLCFYPLSDRRKESNFLILFVGCAPLRLFKILAGRVHIEFNFPKLLRILPDGFELGIGFGMLLFQSGIRNFRNEKSWIPVALWSSY